MARPVNANAEETRRKILDAASALFAAGGYEGTSVRQIAASAGVSLGMIRHYFGSKGGLYRSCAAVAYEVYDELGQQIRDGVASGGVPEQVVADAARAAFRFALANRAAFKLTLWDLMARDEYRSDLGDRRMLPFIIATASALAAPLGRPVSELALATRTMIFLASRWATADHDEVAFLVSGGDPRARSSRQTREALEDYLADTASRLFR